MLIWIKEFFFTGLENDINKTIKKFKKHLGFLYEGVSPVLGIEPSASHVIGKEWQ